jgi:peptide/nickel transport system substrate-binding protein
MVRRTGRGTWSKRWLFLVLSLLLVGGLAWGLTSAWAVDASSSPSAAASPAAAAATGTDSGNKVILKVGWTNDPDNLNPFIGYESSSFEIWHLNYDLLVGYGADGAPAPELATEWSTSTDGKVWTFKLRDDVKWQDGEPFTAKDVAWTLNFIVDNNAAAFSMLTAGIKHVDVVDDYTVNVVCAKPKANMLTLWIPILPEHIWGKMTPQEVTESYANKPEPGKPIIGTGPFQCTEWKKGTYAKMVKNAAYWKKVPTIDEIYFTTYQNQDTMVQELKAGSLDAAYDIPTAIFSQIAADKRFGTVAAVTKSWEYLSFNCYTDPASQGNPVLTDPAFRQAVAWAIDRKKCAEVGWSGYASPGTTMLPPGLWPANWDAHYEPTAEETQGFDLEKAKQMLDAAGYKDVNGDGFRETKDGQPLKLRLWSRAESNASQKQGKFMKEWFTDIGLNIDYRVMDDGAMSEQLYAATDGGNTYAPDYDMYLWDWVGYADPGDTLASFTTDQIWMWNDPCWSNTEYDELAKAQASEIDPAKRLEMLHRMQQIMYVDTPEVILDYPKSLEAFNTEKWEGWVPYAGAGGLVFYSNDNVDSYINLKPKAGSETSSDSGGISTTTWIIIAVAVVVVIVVLIIVLTRRGKARTIEE